MANSLLFVGNNMITHLGHLIVFSMTLHYLYLSIIDVTKHTKMPSGGISVFQKQSNDSAEQEVYSQLKE